MHIKRLRLEGFRFFKLKNIRYFDYVPEKQVQIIVGTSGSGKSSLIKQLSPLPASSDEFYRPGKKEIWIEYQNRQYYLASIFTEDRNMFIFEVDGENLNKGMTVTVYKELVEEHFSYRADIHAILTGAVYFHDMSPNERRTLFMRMNHEDYSFALSVFKKIKDRIKDYMLLLKQLQVRLGSEMEKIIPVEKVDTVKAEIENEKAILRELLNHRRSVTTVDANMAANNDSRLMAAMVSLESTLALLNTNKGFKDPTALEYSISSITETIRTLQAEFNSRCESAEKTKNILQQLKQNTNSNLTSAINELADLENKERKLLSMFKFRTPIDNPVAAETELNKAYDAIHHYVDLLNYLCKKYFSKEWTNAEWADLLQQIAEGNAAIRALEENIKAYDAKLASLAESAKADAIECPSCNHQWKLNYSEEEFKRLTTLRETALASLAAATKKLEAYQDFKNDFDKYWKCLDFAISFYKSPNLAASLKEIDETTPYLKDPVGFNCSLEFLRQDIELHKELVNLRQRKDATLALKKTLSGFANVSVEALEKSLAEDTERIQLLQALISNATAEKRTAESELQLYCRIIELYRSFLSIYQSRQQYYADDIDVQYRQAENEIIHHLQLSITSKDRMLSQAAMQQQNIATLTAEITQLQNKINLLKLAAKELSPTEGLIAKGMTSFINKFVENVNSFIAKHWLYPMEIIPIKIKSDEDFDLDYKFAVSVNDDLDNPTPDIANCSSGMKEIINIAFVAIIMQYLGLREFPIFLDEFAVKMDEAHRKAAYQIIEQLTDILGISQVFVVSHYENSYGSLSNSDLTVLCDANISIPSHLSYNTCLTIQ